MSFPFAILIGLFRGDSHLVQALDEFWDAVRIYSFSPQRQSEEFGEAAERYAAKCRRKGRKPINF